MTVRPAHSVNRMKAFLFDGIAPPLVTWNGEKCILDPAPEETWILTRALRRCDATCIAPHLTPVWMRTLYTRREEQGR